MRGCVRIEGQWRDITLSDETDLLLQWLWKWDGKEAVVIDDAKKIYYCSTEALFDKYKAGGVKVKMFFDLSQKLKPSPSSPTDSPMYCNTYSILCSEREECKEDCCYQGGGIE